jgi:hypothetical protein
VRTKPDKLKAVFVRLAVNQDVVGADMAIAVIVPLAAERMIEIAAGLRLVLCQHVDGFEQQGIEAAPAVASGFLASVIAAKATGVFNNPHSGSRAASQAGRRL